jgi:hypothetical protein
MSGSSSSNPAADAAERAATEPLQLAVHAMPRLDLQAEAATRRTARGRWQLLLVVLACAAPVLASYFAYYVIRPEGRSNYAALIEPARELPAALSLRDLDGRAVDARTLRGQWLLVAVGSGACDGDCEKRLYAQRQLREMTGRERERIDKIWFVTDDAPVKPELRAALAAAPATQVLRVPAVELAAWLAPAPGESLGSHLYLVDPMGRWMMRAPAALEPTKFKRDLERVLRASASWDTAGR